MSDSLSFVELLQELGAELRLHRENDGSLLEAVCLDLPDGRQILAVQRSYRDGVRVFFNPTPDELVLAASGDLWELWNSNRSQFLIDLI